MYIENKRHNYLVHHGIDGQKWGVRNGPPYPLSKSRNIHYKVNGMSNEDYAYACELWAKHREAYGLTVREKEYVYEEFDNNLTQDEKTFPIVSKRINNTIYTAINKGHNQYKIIIKHVVEGKMTPEELQNEVLSETVGRFWRDYDD